MVMSSFSEKSHVIFKLFQADNCTLTDTSVHQRCASGDRQRFLQGKLKVSGDWCTLGAFQIHLVAEQVTNVVDAVPAPPPHRDNTRRG